MFMGSLFVLMLLAAQNGDGAVPYRPASKVATASVTIVSAERISDLSQDEQLEKRDRQVRIREEKSLIEFF